MLRIALPNKGSLSEGAVDLVTQAGYRCKRWERALMVSDADNAVEFVFLRPRDIPVYVAGGIIQLGITGRDLALDGQAQVQELVALGFGRSTFRYAVPAESEAGPADFEGFRIATSYPNLVAQDMAERGVNVEIVRLDGAVEISIRLGVADAIADVVESGRTLRNAGLKTVGDPLLHSEGVVLGQVGNEVLGAEEQLFLRRLRGILVARDYVMVEYDCPKSMLKQATTITPGIESPTVAPLDEPDWVAVKSMARKRDVNPIMDTLADLGAKGILITDIRTCRL